MSRRVLSTAFLILTFVATLIAGEKPFVSGKVVDVYPRQKVRDVTWVGRDVPLYTYDPLYDIAIEVGGEVYVVRWEPVTPYFPAAWRPGREIDVQPGRHSLVLKREAGEEAKVPVISRESSQQWHATPRPAPTEVLPPVLGGAPYPR